MLTTIKGGNPAITGHGFNGTIKDLKIVDAWKVMYAEPAGNVTVDNIYVTGATYGLHLVAYSEDLTWTIQNSYMDLAWANSFGVYGGGDAAIVVTGNQFESTSPYYPDYGALHVNTFLPNVTVTENIFGENAKIYIDKSVSDLSLINIAENYHADGVENAFADDADGVKVDINKYYTTVDEDGNLSGLVTIVNGLSGEGTETAPYLINTVDELVFFRNSVNAGETKYNAPGVYVALAADIDLAGENWVGIGSATADHGFMGNFDGNGKTIKNLTINNPTLDSDGYAYAGLFSVTEGTDKNNQNSIKNLTIVDVTINTTGHIVAAAIAYPYYTTVENVTVCGNIAIQGGDYTAGALAYTRRCVNASNITVSGDAGSTITGSKTVGGVISDIQMNGGLVADYKNFSVSGVTVSGDMHVGGISGIICKQTLFGASVKSVTLSCNDARVGIVSGSWGDVSTISDVTVEEVEGAEAIIGATYKDAAPVEAKIGDTYYATFDAAMSAEGTAAVELLIEKTITLNDTDDAYAYAKSVKGCNVVYNRTFSNLVWNALYVPFEIPVSELLANYDVAYINDFHSYDDDENGVIEKLTMEVIKIVNEEYTLLANHPYLIRPKDEDAKSLALTLEGVTLAAAEEVTLDCSSMYTKFEVTGSYRRRTIEDLNGCLVMGIANNAPVWYNLTQGTMNPFRLYLKISNRAGSHVKVSAQAAKSIRIQTRGEEGDATSIDNVELTLDNAAIYDLQGRRVLEPQKGGLYIVNGKKVVF